MGDAVLAHVLDRVEQTPLRREPFPHLYFESILPEGFYDALLESLPEPSAYEELLHKDALLPDGSSTRSTFTLDEASLTRVPEGPRATLRHCQRVFGSEEFRDAVFAKYRDGLRERFGSEPERLGIEGTVKLQRDVPGYRISIHPDTSDKIILVQLYLPPDDSHASMGTSLYTRRHDGEFGLAEKLEFRRNSGYSFLKGDASWHGVDPIDAVRDSLTLNYRLTRQRLWRAFKKRVVRRARRALRGARG